MNNIIIYTNCPCCNSTNIYRVLDVKDHSISQETFQVWQCEDCKLRFTQNVPSKESIGRYYQSENYISHSDTKKGLVSNLYHLARNITLKSKRNLVTARSGKRMGSLLDVGAGTGAFLQEMKNAGWNITGVEPDAGARQKAKDLYEIDVLPAENFFQLEEKKFDVITMWHVMEHVHELHPYVDQLRKLLKDDGVLMIAVPNYTSADAASYHYFWAAYDVPRHLYHFSPQSMQVLMQQHHFKVTDEKPMWFDALYVSMLSEQYRKSSLASLSGAVKGIWFNFKALFNKRRCSSLIYIVRKV